MRYILKAYGFLIPIAGIVIALDQWTKTLVRNNLDYQEVWAPWPWIEPYFRIVHWHNTGAAFGMLQELGGIFAILSIIVSIIIVIYFPRVPKEEWPLRVAMGLQLGGALGNLIDRIVQGHVTDFISVLHAFNLPVFNIADASITTGVVVLIVGFWIKERQLKIQADKAEPDQDSQRVKSSLREENWSE